MGNRIAIRFGHALLKNGLKTSANDIVNEYDTVREFGPYVVNVLIRAGLDVVNVTPKAGKYVNGTDDLSEGINTAKSLGCNIFVSLHLNCGGGTGSEVLYKNIGKDIAACIQSEIVKLGFRDRGTKQRTDLAELNTTFKAVIVESFFCDSNIDVNLYQKIGSEKLGQAIANGIMSAIGITPEAIPVVKEDEESMLIIIPNGVPDLGPALTLASNKKGAVLDWGLVEPNDDVIVIGGPENAQPQKSCRSFKVITGASRKETAQNVSGNL